jgi:hypothetical protein
MYITHSTTLQTTSMKTEKNKFNYHQPSSHQEASPHCY